MWAPRAVPVKRVRLTEAGHFSHVTTSACPIISPAVAKRCRGGGGDFPATTEEGSPAGFKARCNPWSPSLVPRWMSYVVAEELLPATAGALPGVRIDWKPLLFSITCWLLRRSFILLGCYGVSCGMCSPLRLRWHDDRGAGSHGCVPPPWVALIITCAELSDWGHHSAVGHVLSVLYLYTISVDHAVTTFVPIAYVVPTMRRRWRLLPEVQEQTYLDRLLAHLLTLIRMDHASFDARWCRAPLGLWVRSTTPASAPTGQRAAPVPQSTRGVLTPWVVALSQPWRSSVLH